MRAILLIAPLALAVAVGAGAQQILIDRGVRAGGLWCFPLESDPSQYLYLPTGARLATDDEGAPQFSFVRYVLNRPTEGSEGSSITGAGGGAVLHFLVLYETPPEWVETAQRELRSRLEDDELVVRGPMVFSDGRYNLVSSILREDGQEGREILASGRAPVLEGNRLALSFDLDPVRSSLLLESFRMPTPDISLVFDMTFGGLTDAYEAKLTVDWSEVKQSHVFSAGGTVYFVSADVEAAFERLRRDHAIRLESAGSAANMEALLSQVYDKLLELMFRPVAPERVPNEHRGGLLDALGALTSNRGGALSSRQATGFGAFLGYQLKDIRSEGISVLDFDHRSTAERHHFITFNVGDLYTRYGEDSSYFHTVNLDDAAFQQREIHVAVDGALLQEFDRFVNNVTVTLRKRHQNGAETLRELVLDREAVETAVGDLRMVYGWNGDGDRLSWLHYDFKTRWNFQGGGTHETEWLQTDAPMIDLFAPYERRKIEIVGGADDLTEQGVRAVVVRVEHSFFGERRSQQLVLRSERGELERETEITLPLGEYSYDYTVTWMMADRSRRTASGSDDSGVIFVDELPDS